MASIVKLPSGKYKVSIRKLGHKPIYKTFTAKAAAERFAKQTEVSIEQGDYIDLSAARKWTVEKLLDKYQAEVTPQKRSASKEVSRINLLKAVLGHHSLANLTKEVCLDYASERLEEVESDTLRKELTTLGHAISVAMSSWGVTLAYNPVEQARDALKHSRQLTPGAKRDRRLSAAEERILLDSPLGDVVTWALETAMRRGEVLNAKREHIKQGVLLIPQTKNGKPRSIPLTKKTLEIVLRQPANESGLIFAQWKPDSLSHAFQRLCTVNKIEDLRWHDLRHEATSRLFERGLRADEVMLITGHSSLAMLSRYTHTRVEDLREKMQAW